MGWVNMAYKNIVFVKLKWKELLHEDTRFIDDLNDAQKGLFLMLFLLAGATDNNIKNDENFLKRTLNLSEKPEKIRETLDIILKTFPKLVSKSGYLKFKNFKDLHNWVGNRSAIARDDTRESQDKIRIDKIRLDKILRSYCFYKNWIFENLSPRDFARNYRVIKNLIERCQSVGDDDSVVVQAIEWMSKQNYEWTLETVDKKWMEFLAKGRKSKEYLEMERMYNEKSRGTASQSSL